MTVTPAGSTSAALAAPKPSLFKRLLRWSIYAAAFGLVAICAANVLWQMSGSGQWQLELERDGVKVYSLKAPGAYNKQFKATMRSKFTLNQLVGGLIENATLDNCKQHIPGCIDLKVIQPWSSKTMSDTVLWKLELPPPFLPRESLIRSQVSQDPRTLAVTIDIIGAPNAAPRNPDAIRMTHVQNRWIYTPVGNGEVDIEFLQDIDMGGLFPDFLINLGGADETYKFIHDQLPALLDRDDLRKVRYDFIVEAA